MSATSSSSGLKKRKGQSLAPSPGVEEIDTKKNQVPVPRVWKLRPPTLWQRTKFVLKVLMGVAVVAGAVTYYLESPINPEGFSLPTPPALEGALAPNTRLLDGVKLLEGKIRGPECLAEDNGKIFTGTYDGGIFRITNESKMRSMGRLGSRPCGTPVNEPNCGRPLGLRIYGGEILVMDSYMGLFRVKPNGFIERLVSSTRSYDRFPIKYGNDLEKFRGKNRDFFFIDSSKTWNHRQRDNALWEANGCGRLMWFNPINNMSNIAVPKLYYPTGIQFSPDEDFMLISEATRFRILKYHFQGPLSGGYQVFASNLPGMPMKVRPSVTGGYWVALAHVGGRIGTSIPIFDFLYARPWLRTIITKYINPETLTKWLSKYGMILELDQQGKILQSLHDPTGQMVSSATSVLDMGDALYIGSAEKDYIVKIRMEGRQLPEAQKTMQSKTA
ncbi:adipocyte plasma membrane-associated protein-like [Acanthaster planci]|uniref:Adipocyte plasma membrane-associated protein-like n=1 Tax=Acanthaster planci TaxID=133434 RepID=A0A8B7YBH6_ACAPL|nr:adipocyte plasma membrane-associated protein-like [Acanthaster planci]XP_022089050.1 adipocyte plasma membrane-associated protein-like [Acanthaster planci]XP_022089051.1 adipocyte plasma membrane-associated protein-like [Acanthaster planci]XP_022089052.1 adipocyte plasma membrane-associated protein-like [Acanthaster planci]